MVTPVAKRQAVVHACTTHEVSERRACQALGVDRSTVRYRSLRPDDGAVRLRIRELAHVRRRFGYRRLHFLLKREGLAMNQKRFRRLYREEGLQVRKRGGRKRALGLRAPLVLPSRPNERWSLDFVSDTFTDGRRFRALAVVDDCTHKSQFQRLARRAPATIPKSMIRNASKISAHPQPSRLQFPCTQHASGT